MPYSTQRSTISQIQDNSGITFHQGGNLYVERTYANSIPHEFLDCVRGVIVDFSPSAAQRMRRYLRESRAQYTHMVTLTYPGEFTSNGAESKNHLRRFIQEMQRDISRRRFLGENVIDADAFSVFWFLEFQERGAPHYHLFTNAQIDKDWVSECWYRIVGSDDIRHLLAGTRCEKLHCGRGGTVSYALKYATKADQKRPPDEYLNVGRFWGVWGDRVVVSADTACTVKQLSHPDVIPALYSLRTVIKAAIARGEAEVLKKEDGIYLVLLKTESLQQFIRYKISCLALQTRYKKRIFLDAEVDPDNFIDAD